MAAHTKVPGRCTPLSSLEELLSWQPGSRANDEASRSTTVLQQSPDDGCPRLLACHDLAGGYGDDSLINGGSDLNQFAIYSWHLIDIFVYFSHHLVTIPPPGWTNAAHLHNVLASSVLGTFITEWEAGQQTCEVLFESMESAEQAAKQLAAISQYFHFEGWLVNIENNLDESKVPHLLHFLRTLRKLMHQADANAYVIWYDAITCQGQLRWQDNLTELNQPFFDACDGLFVNYTWKAATPQQAATAAGSRARDVYMGVDVFGRNTFGGGGFNSNLGLMAAHAQGLSCALFAPGWVWEDANPRTTWQQRSARFWELLEGSIRASRAPRAITRLPFSSSFSQGCGEATFHKGTVQLAEPWYNLSKQDVQPLFQQWKCVKVLLIPVGSGARLGLTWLEATVAAGQAYNGGSYVRIEGKLAPGQREELLLFRMAVSAPETGLSACICSRMFLPDCSMSLRLACQPAASSRAASELQVAGVQPVRQGLLSKSRSIQKEQTQQQRVRQWPGGWLESRGVLLKGLPGTQVSGISVCCSSHRADGRFAADIGEVSVAASIQSPQHS